MDNADFKTLRTTAGWTQVQAAGKLGVTQAYLSMVERGMRPVSDELTAKALQVFEVPPMQLPLKEAKESHWTTSRFEEELGAMGYPGYAYLRGTPSSNPAELLLAALNTDNLGARVREGLPWLPFHFPEMNWRWLVSHAKLANRQNRLAYVVQLAMQVADKHGMSALAKRLDTELQVLELSRLAGEDTLCHQRMTQAERRWLLANRPAQAAHWNLLTDLVPEHLAHVVE